jgi:hypothetical protein
MKRSGGSAARASPHLEGNPRSRRPGPARRVRFTQRPNIWTVSIVRIVSIVSKVRHFDLGPMLQAALRHVVLTMLTMLTE